MQDFYGRFQSLHSYVPIADADEFLTEISGPGRAGYERWRYTLIEDRPLPRNSPETLSAIWGVCVQMAEQNLWNNQRVQMPDKQLTQHFCQQLEMLMVNVSVGRQDAGEEFRDLSGEIRGWLWRAGHPLNAFAEVLWNFSRYGSHGAEGVSDWLSEALTRWVRDVLANPAASARTSLRAFLNRAQGHTPDGASIRWNPQPERFEATPWSLEDCFVDALPREAILIADPVPRATPLNTLWVAARESGCRVLENRRLQRTRGPGKLVLHTSGPGRGRRGRQTHPLYVAETGRRSRSLPHCGGSRAGGNGTTPTSLDCFGQEDRGDKTSITV